MSNVLKVGQAVFAGTVVAALAGQTLLGTPPPKGIALEPLGEYRTGLYDEGAVEISAYDPVTRRAFLTLAGRPEVRIVDLTLPSAPVAVDPSIDLTPWGTDAHATSVAVLDGVVAVAVPQGEDDSAAGKVLFFDAGGQLLSEVTVGALPDMVTFSPNGTLVLTANEGQPNQAYTIDPEGSVSVIDVRRGAAAVTQADVSTIGFADFNTAALDPSIRILRRDATVAQDLEPEYIAVSHDSRTAWVTLQENNAIAEIDLKSRKVVALRGLGFKDHAKADAGLDGGRDDGANRILPWPVLGMYQPDGIATLRSRGATYLVTANEGDVREYEGLQAPKPVEPDVESVEIEDISLDAAAFPYATALRSRPSGIGRLKVSAFDGDDDGDGDYDRLFTFGARSFSIRATDGTLLFDSGDAFEQITSEANPARFNASSTNNTRDDRSDDKGPEPEGVTVASVFGRTYIFVTLERVGGIMVYEAIDPVRPRFVQYVNLRDFSKPTSSAEAGDLAPEAARFVPAELSPNGRPLLLVSNEVSGSLRVFAISPAK